MKNCKDKPRRFANLTFLFTVIVFFVFLITMALVALILIAAYELGILDSWQGPHIWIPLILLALASVAIGTIIAFIFIRIPMKPATKIINGLNSLAEGKYETRLGYSRYAVFKRITDSFNTLAQELQETEMLRADFVNNFSHEFKTPIVSIRGFAKLLQRGDLPPEQQEEYLDIIVSESTRLADMATNVLNLTKIENQNILTDVSQYNLSEQLRTCILLLEKQWSAKHLTIDADFSEYFCTANEELLQQVWINLLDNAIKFSYKGSIIYINIEQKEQSIAVTIANTGDEINEQTQKRIFDKFYQGDESHATAGTGIGLAIVKKIVGLHGGEISVSSNSQITVFTVELPMVR